MNNKLILILKIVSAICAAILGVFGAASLTGCNVTRASIRQPKDGSVTSITITTNNPSTVSTTTNADIDVLNKPQKTTVPLHQRMRGHFVVWRGEGGRTKDKGRRRKEGGERTKGRRTKDKGRRTKESGGEDEGARGEEGGRGLTS